MFRTIYVAEPSHDISALSVYTDKIKFITSGFESVKDIERIVEENLKEFDPIMDAVVPVGRVISSLIIGMVLSKKCNGKPLNMAVYKDKTYTFTKI